MARGYHHATRDQRCQIYVLRASGCSPRAIARQLDFHASTISREIRRNKGRRGYRIDQADRKANERRLLASQAAKKITPECSSGSKNSLEQSGVQSRLRFV